MHRYELLARVTAAALALLLFPTFCWTQGSDDLPDGPGKDAVQSLCQGCHDLDVIAAERNDRAGWTETVRTMKSRGAGGTDQDFQTIIDYLTNYLGKINVNTATGKEIASTLDLTSDESDAIVEYRRDHGNFKDWDDLMQVKGVDLKKLEAKKDRIDFQSSESEAK